MDFGHTPKLKPYKVQNDAVLNSKTQRIKQNYSLSSTFLARKDHPWGHFLDAFNASSLP